MEENFEDSENKTKEEKKPAWYVIHTKTGYEGYVKRNLERLVENNALESQIFDVKIPTYETAEEKNGKRRIVEKKYFPNYVFVKMIYSTDLWYLITNSISGTLFLGVSGKAEALPESDVRKWRLEPVVEKSDFAPGDAVVIDDGPLRGAEGVVKEVNAAAGKAIVSLTLFGSVTEAEVGAGQISKKPE